MPDTNIRKLYSLYFAEWLLDAGDVNLLSLGDHFDERILKIVVFKDLVEKEVGLLSEGRVARLVGGQDQELDDADQANMIRDDTKFRKLARTAPAEVRNSRNQEFALWALGLRPKMFADFDYWCKFDKFSLDELVWLSTGLSPQSASTEKELQRLARAHTFPLAEIERRRALIIRAFPQAQRVHVKAVEFCDWASRVGLKWHTGFHEMVEAAAIRVGQDRAGPTKMPATGSSERAMQPRQFRTAAKIITAIAIDAYGHVPNEVRSKTTKDILDACDKAGLTVSNDTILKFLRAGEAQMEDPS
jgi:hypothetical protein